MPHPPALTSQPARPSRRHGQRRQTNARSRPRRRSTAPDQRQVASSATVNMCSAAEGDDQRGSSTGSLFGLCLVTLRCRVGFEVEEGPPAEGYCCLGLGVFGAFRQAGTGSLSLVWAAQAREEGVGTGWGEFPGPHRGSPSYFSPSVTSVVVPAWVPGVEGRRVGPASSSTTRPTSCSSRT
jgi:hypothetical protein